jgi:hypothetical protein
MDPRESDDDQIRRNEIVQQWRRVQEQEALLNDDEPLRTDEERDALQMKLSQEKKLEDLQVHREKYLLGELHEVYIGDYPPQAGKYLPVD